MRSLMAAFCALALIAGLAARPDVTWAQAGTPAKALTTCGTPGNSPVNGNYYSVTTDLKSQLCVSTAGQTGTAATQVQGTSASGATDDGSNPVKVGCIASTGGFIVSVSAGQRANLACTNNGSIGIGANGPAGGIANLTIAGANASSAASQGLQVEEDGRPFANINTNTTTTVKSGAGYLHTLCINTKGASANTATIYDSTTGSGTKIATMDTTSAVECQLFDVRFGTGLTIVTATGTAPDITVSYR